MRTGCLKIENKSWFSSFVSCSRGVKLGEVGFQGFKNNIIDQATDNRVGLHSNNRLSNCFKLLGLAMIKLSFLTLFTISFVSRSYIQHNLFIKGSILNLRKLWHLVLTSKFIEFFSPKNISVVQCTVLSGDMYCVISLFHIFFKL